jgi:hypothetical protein
LNNPIVWYAAKLTFWVIFLLHLFMKLKLTPLYILSFLFLLFLVHEIHDWSHALMARAVSPCWGLRIFDGWDFCAGFKVTSGQRALALFAGPIINYILLWVGWGYLDPENPLEEQSLGCSLVFATLPLNGLLAAFDGGGDLTNSIRWLQQHGPSTNHSLVTIMGLLLVLGLTVPPLLRAFLQLPGYKGKLFIFPILLLVPIWLDRMLVGKWLNNWLISPAMSQAHVYGWVIGWGGFLLIGWLLTRQWLETLMSELSF